MESFKRDDQIRWMDRVGREWSGRVRAVTMAPNGQEPMQIVVALDGQPGRTEVVLDLMQPAEEVMDTFKATPNPPAAVT